MNDPRKQEPQIETVLGPVPAAYLGRTLTHEHVFLDMRSIGDYFEHNTATTGLTSGPSIEDLGEIRRDYSRFPDMGVLDDVDLAIAELSEFRKLGGGTVVDVTTNGFRTTGAEYYPDFANHRRVAEETGLNILVATGYYVEGSHPGEVGELSITQLADAMIRDAMEGFGDSGVKAAVIGEIGMSQPVHPNEWKVLEAACIAQKTTGLPLTIHPYFGVNQRVAPDVMEFVVGQGCDPARVNACHMDGHLDLGYLRGVLATGVRLSFDAFGLETYYDRLDFNYLPHDGQRIEVFKQLLEEGYEAQLMMSQDVCLKHQLKSYGGFGYGHILRSIYPAFEHRGVDSATLDRIMIDNTRRWLVPA